MKIYTTNGCFCATMASGGESRMYSTDYRRFSSTRGIVRVCCLTHNEQIVNNLLKTFFVKVHE